jgi:zona occludens toxin
MITLLTGSPGHGKSYSMVKEIEAAVAKGEPVGTNVPLREDWATVMAKRHVLFSPWRKNAVARKAAEFSRLVIVSNDFSVLLRIRLAGEGESRGKLILDEAHRWLNVRGWDNALDEDGVPVPTAVAKANRAKVINHLSGHRHYGFDVILATQSGKALDTHARELYEFHSEVRNMRKLPWVGFFLRFNLFLRVTRWNDAAKSKSGVNLYGLNKGIANLYHTHALQEADWPADAIVLPLENPCDLPDGSEDTTFVQLNAIYQDTNVRDEFPRVGSIDNSQSDYYDKNETISTSSPIGGETDEIFDVRSTYIK